MIRDDVSDISASACNVLSSPTAIVSYPDSRTRIDYTFVGGKWLRYRTQTSNYGYDISSYNCIDITELNSYAWIEPIYYMIAFFLFVASVLLFRWSVRGILGRY